MSTKKGLGFIITLMVILIFCFIKINHKPPYSISEGNVKSIYCKYYTFHTKILPISDSGKKMLIAEIGNMILFM